MSKIGYKKNITYVDKNGYKRYSDSNKLVHRHVVEMKLGRKLGSGEVVHHINRNKLDNRRKNLWVFNSQQKHHKTHKQDEENIGQW